MEGMRPMPIALRTRHSPATESRNSEGQIRGGPDAGSLPRVDRGAEEGLDPIVPSRAPVDGGEVRIPDSPRAPRSDERLLRSEGGNSRSRPTTPRRAAIRGEPLARPAHRE